MIFKLLNTESKRTLASNFLSLIVLRGFQFLIPLVTLPYLVRVVGIEKFGLINFALAFGMYFGAVIQFGFAVTGTREIARNRHDLEAVKKIFSSTLIASVLLAVICIIAAVIIVFSFDRFRNDSELYFYSLIFVIFQSLFPIWFFQGMERMKYITFLSLGSNLIFLSSLFIFVQSVEDYALVVALNAISAACIFLISIFIIKRYFKISFNFPQMDEIKSVYINGYHAFISQLAPNLYNNSSMFLLGLYANATTVGLYAAAIKVVEAVISLGYILSNAFLPYISLDITRHHFFKKIMFFSGMSLTIIICALSSVIAKLLFGDANLAVAQYIQYLAISIFFVFMIQAFGNNYLMLIGSDYIVKNITLLSSIVFFIVALLLIPIYGIWGAIMTLVGARLTMALALYLYYLKNKQVHF